MARVSGVSILFFCCPGVHRAIAVKLVYNIAGWLAGLLPYGCQSHRFHALELTSKMANGNHKCTKYNPGWQCKGMRHPAIELISERGLWAQKRSSRDAITSRGASIVMVLASVNSHVDRWA